MASSVNIDTEDNPPHHRLLIKLLWPIRKVSTIARGEVTFVINYNLKVILKGLQTNYNSAYGGGANSN